MSEHTTPEWMTAEWLKEQAVEKCRPIGYLGTSLLAREIRRLRVDLAKVTAERDFSDAARVLMAKDRDAARAEVERLANERAELMETFQRNEDRDAGIDPQPLNDDAILSRGDISELVEQAKMKRGEAAGRSMREIAEFEMVCTRSEYVSMANALARLLRERDAAIRDRNEERERFNLLSQRCSVAEARRDELRETLEQAQGDAEHALGGPRESLMQAIRELRDDRNEFAASELERFESDCWRDPNHPLFELRPTEALKIRAAELRKAAGAAAPVIIDEAPGATLPDVEPVVASGKAVEFSTPAADARQPLPLGRLEEMRSAYAAGAEKGTMTEPTKSRCRDAVRAIDELIDIRARLAASEKAKAELLDWCCQGGKNLCPTPGSADSFGDGIRRARQVIRGILAAAERAGGAS